MSYSIAELEQTNSLSIGKAYGKLILIGEHSVVYGYPAIATPLDLFHVTTYVSQTSEPFSIQCEFFHGPIESAPVALNGLVACIKETCKRLNLSRKGILLLIESDLPSGSGLGSSAAVAASVVRGLYSYQDCELSHETLMALVHIAEAEIHGKPSGIDSQAVVAEGAFWFKKEQPSEILHFKRPLHLVVADSGEAGNTKSAVLSVNERLKENPEQVRIHLERLGKLTHEARKFLISGEQEQLGNIFNEAQFELEALGVSNGKLQRLIESANRKGAVGAKLTGSGRGGCFFALARDENHAKELSDKLVLSGAKAAWPVTIEGEGVFS